jgi:transposase-like protein
MKAKQTRRKFTPAFKAQVAIEAIKEQYTLAELARKHDVSMVLISKWKADFLANAAQVFDKKADNQKAQDQDHQDQDVLLRKIGRLQIENDFLKKSAEKLGLMK